MAAKAVVTFLVAERTVDDLLETAVGGGASSIRWFVIGRDMPLLGALVAQWRHVVDISVVHAPAGTSVVGEAVLLMLEAEGLDPGGCLWLVDGLRAVLPAEATTILDISDARGGDCTSGLLDFLGV